MRNDKSVNQSCGAGREGRELSNKEGDWTWDEWEEEEAKNELLFEWYMEDLYLSIDEIPLNNRHGQVFRGDVMMETKREIWSYSISGFEGGRRSHEPRNVGSC